MSSSFAYEDPLLRSQGAAGMNARQKALDMFKDMGRGMLRSGKGFGKVGALFGGIECVMESVHLACGELCSGPSNCGLSSCSIELKMIW